MPETYYRTGAAAKLLNVSSYTVRELAKTGLIDAEFTGKQWRIPESEIQRMQKEGVPQMPANISAEKAASATAPASVSGRNSASDPNKGLLGPPSKDLVLEAEDLRREDLRLKKLRVQQEKEHVLDFFRERDQRNAERQAEERREEEDLERQLERKEWRKGWMEWATQQVPQEASPEVRLEAPGAVAAALAKLSPDEPGSVVTMTLRAALETALQPWKRKEETRSAIDGALTALPWETRTPALENLKWDASRGRWEETEWELHARRRAAAAIAKLSSEASASEKVRTASDAVALVTAEFKKDQARKQENEQELARVESLISHGVEHARHTTEQWDWQESEDAIADVEKALRAEVSSQWSEGDVDELIESVLEEDDHESDDRDD